MDWFKVTCEKISKRKLIRTYGEDEISTLTNDLIVCEDLLKKINDFAKPEQNFIFKSIIINLISVLESFFKFYFSKMIRDWELDIEPLASTIDRKLKMKDLVHFQSRDIHICELLGEFLNFQDLKDIEKFFRILFKLKKSVFEVVDDIYRKNAVRDQLVKIDKIYPKLQEILGLRHSIVHDVFFNLNLSENKIIEYIIFIKDVMLSFGELIGGVLLKEKNERGIMLLGFLKWNFLDFENAADCFKKCLEIDPEFPGYWISLGGIYYDWEKFEKAIEYYKVFLQKKPEAYDGWYYLGESFLSLENYTESKKAFEKAIELKPDDITCIISFVECLYNLEEYEPALNIINRILKIDDRNIIALYMLGIIYDEMEQYEKAFKSFDKVLELEHDDVCHLCSKGRVLVELERFKEAIPLLEEINSLEPKIICYLKYLADAYNGEGELVKAISILERGVKLAEDNNNQTELAIIKERLEELEQQLIGN